MSIEILLADDHKMVRTGLRYVLERNPQYRIAGEVADGRAAVSMARQVLPDLILMDVFMPLLNGVDATRQILAEFPQIKIIGLSLSSDPTVVKELIKSGASGYVLKSSEFKELSLAIDAVIHGQMYLSPEIAHIIVDGFLSQSDTGTEGSKDASLSPREREVLQLVAEGKTSKEMASILHLSAKTIDAHRAQIMDKLGLRTVASLTKHAVRMGLTALDS